MESKKKNMISSQISNQFNKNSINSTNIGIKDIGIFSEVAKNLEKVSPEIKQGNLFEYIETAKFNSNAAAQGKSYRAFVTANEGNPHAAADILIKNKQGEILKEIQAKSSKSPLHALKQMFKKQDKYEGMDLLTNKGYKAPLDNLADKGIKNSKIYNERYSRIKQNSVDELKYGKTSSGGTSYDEVMKAANNSEKYSSSFSNKLIAKEAGKAALTGAATGAVLGGAISSVKNFILYKNGDVDIEDAINNTLKESAEVAGKGAVTGALGGAIRGAAQKKGLSTLAKGNVAVAIAAGLVETSGTIIKFAKGEISERECMLAIGETGVSSISSIYAGAVAGAAFGPVGSVVGSIAGYMISTTVYQSCMIALNKGDLAIEEAKKIRELANEAMSAIENYRTNFENEVSKELKVRDEVFEKFLESIENYNSNDLGIVINGISEFALVTGRELKLLDYEEFDSFMGSSEVLIF